MMLAIASRKSKWIVNPTAIEAISETRIRAWENGYCYWEADLPQGQTFPQFLKLYVSCRDSVYFVDLEIEG